MSATDRDALLDGMGNGPGPLLWGNKNTIGNQAAGGYTSFWKSVGFPVAGANPTAAAVCTKATAGGWMNWTNPVAPERTYIGYWSFNYQNTGGEVQLHDRLAHMGGLSGTVTTAQTVGVDVSLGTDNLPNRVGASDYSEVLWWLEWYTDTGAASATCTLDVTYHDGTTATITGPTVNATTRASRVFPIRPGTAGKYIKSIQSITLSGSTGTAGNFGVTATRCLAMMMCTTANTPQKENWADLGFPRVHDDACLFVILQPSAVGTIDWRTWIKLVQK